MIEILDFSSVLKMVKSQLDLIPHIMNKLSNVCFKINIGTQWIHSNPDWSMKDNHLIETYMLDAGLCFLGACQVNTESDVILCHRCTISYLKPEYWSWRGGAKKSCFRSLFWSHQLNYLPIYTNKRAKKSFSILFLIHLFFID